VDLRSVTRVLCNVEQVLAKSLIDWMTEHIVGTLWLNGQECVYCVGVCDLQNAK